MHVSVAALHSICMFFSQVSPNNKLVAYAEDTKGDEIHNVYVIDIESGALIEKPLTGLTTYLEWAGNDSLIYITMDEILRPDKVCFRLNPCSLGIVLLLLSIPSKYLFANCDIPKRV